MTKDALIDNLIAQGYLQTPRIIKAFKAIDRRDFVRSSDEKQAYANYPLPIGYGQTISQPLTVAFMLEKLQPEPGDKILDIGSGSGWSTALLAHCAGIEPQDDTGNESDDDNPRQSASTTRNNSAFNQRSSASTLRGNSTVYPRSSAVYAIERIPDLCEFGRRNVSKYFKTNHHCWQANDHDHDHDHDNDNDKDNDKDKEDVAAGFIPAHKGDHKGCCYNQRESASIYFFCRDGSKGLPEYAPFDKIIAAASASKVPPAWKKQLKIGGILVFPMPGALWRYTKKSKHKFKKEKYPGFSFVPLVR